MSRSNLVLLTALAALAMGPPAEDRRNLTLENCPDLDTFASLMQDPEPLSGAFGKADPEGWKRKKKR